MARHLDMPAAYVDLGYLNSVEALTDDMRARLSELGASAAETIIRQIENEKETSSKRPTVEARLPPAYFDLLRANLGPDVEARESA